MVELSQLCLAIVDCEHKTAPKSAEGHPLVRTTDIGRGRLDLSNVQRVDAGVYEEWTRRAVPQPGDLILAREAPVGNVAIVTPGLEPVLGQRTVLIRPDLDRVDPHYLTYRLLAYDLQHWMHGVANGSTVPHLNMEDIRSLPVPALPPLRAQRAAGGVLAAFDDAIENNRKRIEILEDAARLIYREWFANLRFPGHECVEFVDCELGQFPADWECVTLGEAAKWMSGGTPSTTNPDYWGGNVPWITSGSLTSFLLDDSERKLTPLGVRHGSKVVGRDATIFVVRGMSLAKTFRHGIADREVAFGQDCKALIARNGIHPLYLAFSISSLATDIQRMVEYAAHGTGKLSTDRIRAMSIPRPPVALQEKFVDVVGPMRELMSNLRSQIRTLEGARDLLLPRIFSGELDLSDLALDLEPVV